MPGIPGSPGGTRREGRESGEDRRACIAFPGRALAVEAGRQDSGRRGHDGGWAVPPLGPVAHARNPGPEEDRLSGRAAGGEVRVIGKCPRRVGGGRAGSPGSRPGRFTGSRASRGRPGSAYRPAATARGRSEKNAEGRISSRACSVVSDGRLSSSDSVSGRPRRSRAGARVNSGGVSAANEGFAPRAADPQESVPTVSRAAGGAASARTGRETVGVRPGAGKAGSDGPRRGEQSVHGFGRKRYNPMIFVA